MPTLYHQLRNTVLAAGVEKKIWVRFILALRSTNHGQIACWTGRSTPGRMILRAWRREFRVSASRVQQVAQPLIVTLKSDGADGFRRDLSSLKCTRGYESAWGCPDAGDLGRVGLASGTTVRDLCRYYFDLDSGLGLISKDDLNSIAFLLQNANPVAQRKALALFQRPLGKRRGVPASCKSLPPPYNERFDMVWSLREEDLAALKTTDDVRDALGLVHFRKGEDLLFLTYMLTSRTSPRTPTAIEALGGWAYWPHRNLGEQSTMNYYKGTRGPREFVHSADVSPDTMGVRWMGRLVRNWDDG